MCLKYLYAICLFLLPVSLAGQDWPVAQSLGGAGSESLDAFAIMAGKIVVAGRFEESFTLLGENHAATGEEDIYALILDDDGTPQKVFTLGGSQEERVSGLACFGDKIHLYGSYTLSVTLDTLSLQTQMGTKGLYIAQYDTTGAVQWARSLEGNILTVSGGLAHDNQGRLYLTGYFYDTLALAGDTLVAQSTEGDMFLIQINAQGNLGWMRQAGEAGIIRSTQVAVASNGDIVLAGYFRGKAYLGADSIQTNTVDHDLFVAKMDASGQFLWGKKLGGVLDDELQGLALDDMGNIYLTGNFLGVISDGQGWSIESSGFNNDVFVVKMDSTGQVIWGQRLGDTHEDAATSITTQDGQLAIAGHFQHQTNWGTGDYLATGGLDGIWLVMDAANGTPLDGAAVRGSALEVPSVLSYLADGRLFLAGALNGTLGHASDLSTQGSFDAFWMISDTEVSVSSPVEEAPVFYPNPCSGFLYSKEDAPFFLYNALGQLVGQSQGTGIDVRHLPPGIYWARMGVSLQSILVNSK